MAATKKPAAATQPRPAAAQVPISSRRRARGTDVLAELRRMAIAYHLRPGHKINELELAQRLGVSRTPVREALTKLARDGFLVESGRGYMRRPLNVQETLDLYEARITIEQACVRKAIDRGDAQGADKLIDYLRHSMKVAKSTPVEQLVALDEGFHMSIAELAGNVEFTRILQNLNERIRFVRWIDMENVGRSTTQAEHLRIAEAIRAQDRKAAVQSLESHIALRREQIVEAIKQGLTRIYLEDAAA